MERNEIIKPENKVYGRPALVNDTPMHYCPGCSHSMVHKLVAEVIAEMGVEERTVGICPVGCAVFAYRYIDIDWIEAAHGRAPACACIGTGETIQALNRGENIAIIFINNAIYGMTGGQMAPTTLMGMKTSTCPYGRQADLHGFPLHITDIAATLEGTCYVTRQAVNNVANIARTKRAIRQAFQNSIDRRGASMVEVVSTCAAGWKKSPLEANKWMEDNMFSYYPLGDIKNTINEMK